MSPGRRIATALVLALALCASLTPTAHAQDGEEIFSDPFTELDPSFGEPSAAMDAADGVLTMTMDPNVWFRYFYQSMVYEDLDLTVKVQLPNMTQAKGTGVGIMFWGESAANCYVVELTDTGDLNVRQFTPERTLMPVFYQKNDAIKTEAGAQNLLRLRLVGDLATIFINGKEILTFRGKPPANGSLIGLFGETTAIADVVKFSELKITEPTDAPQLPAADPDVLFADDFSTFDPSFGAPNDVFYVEDKQLVMSLEPSKWWRYTYEGLTFDDVDATVKVKLPDMTAEQGAAIGIMFWTNTIEDMYIFEISDSGTFAVRRHTAGRDLYPVLWRTSDAISLDPEEWNELRVETHGNRATLYINGQEVAKIKGHPAAAGNLLGVYAETSADGGVEARFSDFKVVAPGPSNEPASNDDPSALIADDFSELDPAWGAESGTFGVKEGRLFATVEKGYGTTKMYQADIFNGDIDSTVTVAGNDGSDDSVCDIGYIFWGSGYDDFWTFDVYDNGTMGVGHYMNQKWLLPMKGRPIPAEAKFDPNGKNTLRVVTKGRKATFYINGVEVGSVAGQPPKEGTYLGLYAGAGGVDATVYFDDLLVKQAE